MIWQTTLVTVRKNPVPLVVDVLKGVKQPLLAQALHLGNCVQKLGESRNLVVISIFLCLI